MYQMFHMFALQLSEYFEHPAQEGSNRWPGVVNLAGFVEVAWPGFSLQLAAVSCVARRQVCLPLCSELRAVWWYGFW